MIYGVREHDLWRKIYILLDRSLLKVKQVIKNHIRVGKVNICYNMYLFIFTRKVNRKNLLSGIILLIESKLKEKL